MLFVRRTILFRKQRVDLCRLLYKFLSSKFINAAFLKRHIVYYCLLCCLILCLVSFLSFHYFTTRLPRLSTALSRASIYIITYYPQALCSLTKDTSTRRETYLLRSERPRQTSATFGWTSDTSTWSRSSTSVLYRWLVLGVSAIQMVSTIQMVPSVLCRGCWIPSFAVVAIPARQPVTKQSSDTP